MSTRQNPITRRQFVKATAASSVFGCNILHANNRAEKLNMAFIACGGRGGSNLRSFAPPGGAGENVVALCDVDQNAVDRASQMHPGAKKYRDYRRLFDDMRDSEFDAVVVSTTEHTHAFATLPALQRKKHVYCEKPLTHGIREARIIADAAKRAGVVTQMGNQMHSTSNFRRIVELIQSGGIGAVREVHVWVSRAWGQQTEEEARANKDIIITVDSPTETHPAPANIDWEVWLGPAPFRPYNNDVYLPGPRWYRFWDFASGTMSDLGSHWNDLPFWALALDAPKTIEASGPTPHRDLAPASFSATYEYGPRRNPMAPGEMPACKLTWYQGTMKPDVWKAGRIPQSQNGMLFIGEKATLLAEYQRYTILIDDKVVDKFAPFTLPPRTIPDSPGHWEEFVLACKNGGQCGSNFAYAGPLTEANHLASIAFRVGKKIEWDSKNLQVINSPEAQRLVAREYRSGWKLA